MSDQDWTPVVLRRTPKKSKGTHIGASQSQSQSIQIKYSSKSLDMTYVPKKCVSSESLQALIRKRIEMLLNQEKADQLCAFPVNTFKKIESKQLVPTQHIQTVIQKKLNVQLKIETH
jgi:hypothetical protein